MKVHKFAEYDSCFGYCLYRCSSCDCISIDSQPPCYAWEGNWRVVSEDCTKAGKQIEILHNHDERVGQRYV